MHPLRLTRLVVSTLMALAVAAVFLDLGHVIPPSWTSVLTSLQLAPALLKTLTAFGLATAGLVFLLALTLLFGRIYCSHLCPLGVLQDIVIWFRKRNLKHRRFPYARPRFAWHYAITAAVIVSGIGGSLVLLDLLEPFSNSGRILAHVARPLLVLTNNGASILFSFVGIGGLNLIPLELPHWTTLAGVGIFTLTVIILSYRSGRLFCNLLCPVGGVLSLLSHRPAYAITIRGHDCIDCGLCEQVCRAQCIDSKRRVIETAACVGCFDCLESCPTRGMEFVAMRHRTKDTSREIATPATSHEETHKAQTGKNGRRRVLAGMSALVGRWLLPPATESERQTEYDRSKAKPVVPPGGAFRDRFGNLCTACHLCVAACPTQVIQPAVTEYGWAGVFQPRMDYAVNYCTFDCVACGQVCPTGALLPLGVEQKHVLQLGKAIFVKEDCIVETKKKDCGACAEHCPTKAVKMVPYEKLFLPEVNNDYCVGCGACEHACPTIPRRAIYVDAHAVHQAAKVRPVERSKPAQAMPEEFPF